MSIEKCHRPINPIFRPQRRFGKPYHCVCYFTGWSQITIKTFHFGNFPFTTHFIDLYIVYFKCLECNNDSGYGLLSKKFTVLSKLKLPKKFAAKTPLEAVSFGLASARFFSTSHGFFKISGRHFFEGF